MTADKAAGDLLHWKNKWIEGQKQSYLKQTQTTTPERWEAFYDEVASVWDRMAGIRPDTGRALADLILGQGFGRPGDSVLEPGCGPGNLSLALAGRGLKVTALDLSPGMIRVLKERARRAEIRSIDAKTGDWKDLPEQPGHKVVVAACFPEAFSPAGVSRMEALSRRTCILVMGTGRESFPLRRRIWENIMDIPCSMSRFHLDCAENYLKALGRGPKVFSLNLPAVLEAGAGAVASYFMAYFRMFGLADQKIAPAVAEVLAPYISDGRIRLEGKTGLALVAWQVPEKDE